MSSGPHQMNIGWREVRTSRTVTRRLCGQVWGGPSEVFDQSNTLVRAPSSPPLPKKSPTSSRPIHKNLTHTPVVAYSPRLAAHNGRLPVVSPHLFQGLRSQRLRICPRYRWMAIGLFAKVELI